MFLLVGGSNGSVLFEQWRVSLLWLFGFSTAEISPSQFDGVIGRAIRRDLGGSWFR